jgi:hypothetical protein
MYFSNELLGSHQVNSVDGLPATGESLSLYLFVCRLTSPKNTVSPRWRCLQPWVPLAIAASLVALTIAVDPLVVRGENSALGELLHVVSGKLNQPEAAYPLHFSRHGYVAGFNRSEHITRHIHVHNTGRLAFNCPLKYIPSESGVAKHLVAGLIC